jgi:hypothetical protein
MLVRRWEVVADWWASLARYSVFTLFRWIHFWSREILKPENDAGEANDSAGAVVPSSLLAAAASSSSYRGGRVMAA